MLSQYKEVHVSKTKDKSEIESLSMDDAKWFPIQAGGMLCGLYVLIKYFGKEVVNYLLMAYMGVGTGALFKDALMNIPLFANLNDKQLFHLKF